MSSELPRPWPTLHRRHARGANESEGGKFDAQPCGPKSNNYCPPSVPTGAKVGCDGSGTGRESPSANSHSGQDHEATSLVEKDHSCSRVIPTRCILTGHDCV